MAIAPITVGDTGARAKINAAIVEANKVASKADASSLAIVSDRLQAQINDRATSAALASEARARGLADGVIIARVDGLATYAEVSSEHQRLGEPGRFATADVEGPPETVGLIGDDTRAVSATNGSVLSIRSGYVAPIAVRRIEPGRQYRLRFVVQRAEDTQDPANDAIRFAVQWLKADKSSLAQTVIANVLDVQVSSGRLEFQYVVSRVSGDNVDIVCPPGAVYARPFVRCYGSGLTHIEVVEWTDLSNSVEWSPDVSEFRRELAAFEYAIDTLNDRAATAATGLEAATDAGYFKTGTLDDDRLSSNVMLLDEDQTVTGDKTFTAPLRMRDVLLIGDAEATGGGASARISGSGNAFEIAPTNQTGDFIISKTFGFDLTNGVWRAKGGFRAEGALTVTGAISGASLTTPGSATVGTNLTVTADLTVGDDLTVTDDAAVGGDLTVAGSVALVGGTINGTTIGIATPAAGRFTSVDFTDAGTTRTNLDVYSKAYVDNLLAAADAMVFKGVIDCSANPNYPAASAGWTYRVSAPGKIGGASGVSVEIGDLLVCLSDSTASGTQAAVGASWSIAQANLDGAVIGPASATDATPAVFDGVTGKLLKNITFSAFKAALSLAKSDVGLGNVDNTSDANKPVSTAQATALALKFDKAGGSVSGAMDVTGSFLARGGSTVLDGGFFYTPYNGGTLTATVRAGVQFDGTNQNISFYTADTWRGGYTAAGDLYPGGAAQRLGLAGSRWAEVHTQQVTLADGVTAPAATSGSAKIYVDAADGDLKIIFGDGTIKTIVTD